jgi:N-methylhydantoinase B
VRVLGESIKLSNLTDRQKFAPPGILGGEPGALGVTVRNPGTVRSEILESKGTYRLETGDLIATKLAGGGGYGDPLDREVWRIEQDLTDGLLSPTKAASSYGIVFKAGGQEVDAAATDAERQRRRDARSKGDNSVKGVW